MKKEKDSKDTTLKEKVKEDLSKKGLLNEKKKPDQQNLFGEQDAAYNTIQEEITIVADAIKGCYDAIEKKEEQLDDLQKRSQKLHKAAETVAKLRDGALKKKAKKEKEKASWPAEKKKKSDG